MSASLLLMIAAILDGRIFAECGFTFVVFCSLIKRLAIFGRIKRLAFSYSVEGPVTAQSSVAFSHTIIFVLMSADSSVRYRRYAARLAPPTLSALLSMSIC